MKIKKVFFYCICFLCLMFGDVHLVDADMCTEQDVERFRSLANYIEINYDYIAKEDLYSISISGLSNELFLIDIDKYYEYRSADAVDGVISFTTEAKNISFNVFPTNCDSKSLRTISFDLLKYNPFSENEWCQEFSSYELDFCDPWYQGELNLDIFLQKMEPYILESKEEQSSIKDDIFEYLQSHIGLVIIFGIVVIVVIIVLIVRWRNRSVLE